MRGAGAVALAAALLPAGGAGAAAQTHPPSPRPAHTQPRTYAQQQTHAQREAHAGPRGAAPHGHPHGSQRLEISAQFAPPHAFVFPQAITYDRAFVPAASAISVTQRRVGRGTDVGVALHRMRPGHTFGVDVHTKPCADGRGDSGPRYQHRVDPVQPSADPAYANPRNEVRLDMRTDRRGAARRSVHRDWRFRKGAARSVVLHEHATGTGAGTEAGTGTGAGNGADRAGDRVACFTVPFAGGS